MESMGIKDLSTTKALGKLSLFQEIKIPSKVGVKVPAHKQEATCLAFNALGDAIATGGADNLIKIWQAENGKEA